jgi:hypothetical protein
MTVLAASTFAWIVTAVVGIGLLIANRSLALAFSSVARRNTSNRRVEAFFVGFWRLGLCGIGALLVVYSAIELLR